MAESAWPDGLHQLRHDLRTPLTIVIGFAELLASERPLTEDERRDYAQRVVNAAVEMRDAIDALDWAERGPGHAGPS